MRPSANVANGTEITHIHFSRLSGFSKNRPETIALGSSAELVDDRLALVYCYVSQALEMFCFLFITYRATSIVRLCVV